MLLSKRRYGSAFVILLMILTAFCFLCIPGRCQAAQKAGATDQVTLDDLAGKRAGVLTGTPQDQMVQDSVKDAKLNYYNTFADMALALNTGKIDFFVNSSISYYMMQETYPDLLYVDSVVRSFDIGTIFPKTEAGQQLCDQFNEYIAGIKEDGTLQELKDYWLFPKEWKNFDIPKKGANGTLKFGICSSNKPFAMLLNGSYAGFDVAIVAGFCQQYGYGLSIEDSDFAGLLAGITSGKYQLAASQIAWTAERAESVLYSDFYVDQDIVPIIKASDWGIAIEDDSTPESTSFLSSICNSFRRTFIEQARWKSILSGLATTLIITIFGFLLANVLGALFCAMNLSHHRFLHILADIYSRLMQGLPMVVILMLLYYVVLGKVDLSGTIVAIIGFGLVSGAYLAQIFYGSITAIDLGQWEGTLALGFTRQQAFRGIILPQAIRGMLPGYFSQLISLMKSTAIVGYIAVVDLTKAGDIVRSATYEAFFPLISVAIIYFLIASLLLSLLKIIQKKLTPKRIKFLENGGKVS